MVAKPNYNKARSAAQRLMKQLNIRSLPVDLEAIFNFFNIDVFKYADVEEFNAKLVTRLRLHYECDAIVFGNRAKKEYCIWYDEKKVKGRIKFSLAHEIGHIYLGHIFKDNDVFQRTHNSNDPIEKEADVFASELISSPTLLSILNIYTPYDIKRVCGISNRAAEVCSMQIETLSRNTSNEHISFLSFYYNHFAELRYQQDYGKNCGRCKATYNITSDENGDIIEDKFCPICGDNKYKKFNLVRGDKFMKYPENIKLDGHGKATRCPLCDNEEIEKDGGYCHVCGTHLINKCSDCEKYDKIQDQPYTSKSCGAIAQKSNARFCVKCGNETTFYFNGVLKAWDYKDYNEEASDNDPPF